MKNENIQYATFGLWNVMQSRTLIDNNMLEKAKKTKSSGSHDNNVQVGHS